MRDVSLDLGDFRLERGDVLIDDKVMGRLYGPADTPLIVVIGVQVLGYDFAPDPESENRPSCITTMDQAKRLKALIDYIANGQIAADRRGLARHTKTHSALSP